MTWLPVLVREADRWGRGRRQFRGVYPEGSLRAFAPRSRLLELPTHRGHLTFERKQVVPKVVFDVGREPATARWIHLGLTPVRIPIRAVLWSAMMPMTTTHAKPPRL